VLCLVFAASCTQGTADPPTAPKPDRPDVRYEAPRSEALPRLRPDWVYAFRMESKASAYCGSAPSDFKAIPVKRAIGDTESLLASALRAGLENMVPPQNRGPRQNPADWLNAVRVEDGTAHLDFKPLPDEIAGTAGTSSGGCVFQSELVRMAFQFADIKRVTLETNGNCRHWTLFEGEQSCDGIPRRHYDNYLSWHLNPNVQTTTLEALQAKDSVVFYEPGPAGACGERDDFYTATPVALRGDRAVLTRALEALLGHWGVRDPGRRIDVSIDGDVAVVDFRGLWGLGFASTSCGSVVFAGSIIQTVGQFDHLAAVQFRLQGSCTAFSEWWQAGNVCFNHSIDPTLGDVEVQTV
jgi:hypothetical protein